MRTGSMPGQQAAIRTRIELLRRDQRTWTRRAVLGTVVGSVTAGLTGFTLGRRRDSEPGSEPEPIAVPPDLDRARQLAAGPFADLAASSLTFLAAVKEHPADLPLWLGVARLDVAAHRDDPRVPRSWSSALRVLCRSCPPRREVVPLLEDLGE